MNLHFRLLLTILFASFHPRVRSFVETRRTFIAFPTDAHIPFFKAMCGGRYVDFMDLGRVDQVTRLGILNLMIRKGLDISLGGQFVRYFKPLKTFRRFTLTTHIVYWDERFFYVEQKFHQDGVVKAHGLTQACFRGKEGVLKPSDLALLAGIDGTSPPMPEIVRDWLS